MRTDKQRTEKYSQKISGDVVKQRTDSYKTEQVKNFRALAGDQVAIENSVKQHMKKFGLPALHTN